MRRCGYWSSVPLLLVLALLSACNGQPTTVPASTPPPGATSGDLVHGKAKVEEIDILLLESFPIQVNVVARGYLPDGCTTIDKTEEARTDEGFVVTITTVRPADRACTQALVPFEEVIPLDVLGLPAGVHTVNVNGVSGSFEFTMDNVSPQQALPGRGLGAGSGVSLGDGPARSVA